MTPPLPLDSALWTVRAVGDLSLVPAPLRDRDLRAIVPGCIHTDLIHADALADPAIGTSEDAAQWVSWTDWQYRCDFDAPNDLAAHPDATLHFVALDTVATVELNGVEIGRACSEFLPWRFRIAGTLRPGPNRLAVTFTSPLRHVHAEAKRLGPLPANGDWDPYPYLRKCASNFQWDWGPKAATVGITGPVEITTQPPPAPRPPASRRISLDPRTFQLAVDGQDLFVKGVNWIPEGLWPEDRSPARVLRRLQQIKELGANLVRVWGGGRYEPDWFYDACDKMGLLVWQDFMFACACYPEHPEYRALVEAEARHHLARLASHPCVVLWCGGNECEWAYESWGFKDQLARTGQAHRGWGQHYYRQLLPRLVAELSPHTPYIPNTPFSPTPGLHPNDPAEGDRHTWDLQGPAFRSLVPTFCAEFGVQSPSCRETLAQAGLLHQPHTPRLIPEALAARQRGPGGMTRWCDQPMAHLNSTLGPPADTDEWLQRAHRLQADSLYDHILWLRANRPTCRGAIVWQFNDAWPGFSWSLVDSAGREKPAYFAVQRAFSPRLADVILWPPHNTPTLVAINDDDTPWSGSHTHAGIAHPFTVPPRGVVRIPLPALSP